jgi:hypothetical protein
MGVSRPANEFVRGAIARNGYARNARDCCDGYWRLNDEG